jgi:RNA polymerase sigma-70 factor (ECF subfamily)
MASGSFNSVMTGEAAVALPEQSTGVAADRLGVLFDTHHQRLYRLARRLSQNPDDARDLVQETFLRAARSPRSVPDGASNGVSAEASAKAKAEEAWLVQVLVNLCRDRWRQRATRQRLDVRVDSMQAAGPTDPESALVARSMVWHALQQLAPRRRAVLVMHELEGASVEAISRTLGVAAVTVRWHLSRARLQMVQLIRDQGKQS